MPSLKLTLMPALLATTLLLPQPALAGAYEDILAAAENGRSGEVIELLRRGLDVNTTDPQGNTLLMIAARTGNLDLLDFLLRNRANRLRKNKYGDTALMLAVMGNHIDVARRLIETGAEVAHSGWAPLHYAAYSGNEAMARLLLDHKAPLDAKAPNGQTALMLAVANGHLALVRLLIESGADTAIKDAEGRDVLSLARAKGERTMIELLGGERR